MRDEVVGVNHLAQTHEAKHQRHKENGDKAVLEEVASLFFFQPPQARENSRHQIASLA
jgi:hypothetical protein